MELYFLGTGAGMPSSRRNVTSLVLDLLAECGHCWMFDCGEGTQHQVLRSPIKLRKINKLFVSHLHGDHIFGIPGMLSSRSNQGGDNLLTIYGPRGIQDYVENSLQISDTRMNYQLSFVEVDGNATVFENEQFIVTCAHLEHRIESYGYRVIEKDLPGKLNTEKLKQLDIPAGPLFGKLKRGESISLPDGTEVHGKEVIGPPIPGRIVTVLGDTILCDAAIQLADHADVVVHEATFAHEKVDLAAQFYHATTIQAASVAKQANARTLIITHISSRYQEEDEMRMLEEARIVFPQTFMAFDHWTYSIERKQE